jgi:arylsulfatase A-like enzyme
MFTVCSVGYGCASVKRSAAAIAAPLVAAIALAACGGEAPGPRSMVVLVVDTLRPDHLGAYGYAANPTSPRLDAWLARARLYERAFATSPWTLPSMGSILTGSWPVYHGGGRRIRGTFTPLRAELPTLAERFQNAGFGTGAIVSNAFLAPSSGSGRGFALYDFETSTVDRTRRADQVVRTGLAWIDRQGDRPFLLLLHFFDPHLGYDAPPHFRGRFTSQIDSRLALPITAVRALRRQARSLAEPDRRFVGAAYDEEIAAVDEQLGILLDTLEQRGFLQHSLVVLTADHGEELFEHAGFEHGHALWQELLHVPLAFWGVGVKPGRESVPVSLVDLAPTLLDAARLEPLPGAQGISLWPNLSRGAPLSLRPLYAEHLLYGRERKTVIRWPDKLVWVPSTGEWRHFDLARDPGESNPGVPPATPEIRSLQRTASELWHLGSRAGKQTPEPAPLEDDTREALRGLGYIE